MLAKALALDYADRGNRVNALWPGIIDSSVLRSFADAMPAASKLPETDHHGSSLASTA